MAKCPADKYKKKDYEYDLNGNSGDLRRRGKVALQDNVRGRADRYEQVFISPGMQRAGKRFSQKAIDKCRDTSAKNWAKGSTPYDNQAHHVLISELVTEWWQSDDLHYDILTQGCWDQNNGENNIFLPNKPGFVDIHRLPLHRGPHKANYPEEYPSDQYRNDVKAILEKLAEGFDQADPCEKDDNNYTKVEQFLNNEADRLWRKLAKCIYGSDLRVHDSKSLSPDETSEIDDWGDPNLPYGPASYK